MQRRGYGEARQGKLKRPNGSEVNAMAVKTSIKVSLPSLHDKTYPSIGLRIHQAILEETPVLHIHDHNNQRHVLLQRYAYKRVRLEREASSLHNLWNFCSILPKRIRNYLKGLKSKIFLGGACPHTLLMGELCPLL